MKQIFYILLAGLITLFIPACSDDNDVDTEKPLIDIGFASAFPTNCDTLYFGEAFTVKMKFSDNVELGAFSINIHDNFDGHSHSTEVTECNIDPVKEPVNPFVLIDDFTIPDGLTEYETNIRILVPEGNASGLYDHGDYHFFISLTDHEGWSSQKGLSIKILHP